jgi:hypothetical protein
VNISEPSLESHRIGQQGPGILDDTKYGQAGATTFWGYPMRRGNVSRVVGKLGTSSGMELA